MVTNLLFYREVSSKPYVNVRYSGKDGGSSCGVGAPIPSKYGGNGEMEMKLAEWAHDGNNGRYWIDHFKQKSDFQ